MVRVRFGVRFRVRVRLGHSRVLARCASGLDPWVPYSQRYLFNAIPDTNHNANPTNPYRYSQGNPDPTNPTNPNTRYRIIEPSDY